MIEGKRGRMLSFALLLLVAVAVLGSSCTPDSGISASESDIVATVFDDKAPWGKIKTYVMPDTVIHITGDTTMTDDPRLSRQNDRLILDTIAQNFANYGYTRIDTSEIDNNPGTVLVLVEATSIQGFNIWSGWGWYPWWGWWGGWGSWPPGWGPGWGWGWPCCTTVVSSFTIGTLLIEMVDPENADEENKLLPVFWHVALNGVLEGSNQSVTNRVTSGINQAFEQSPYLQATE